MRKKETRRRGRGVGRGGGSIVVQYLSNDITVCSSFILANETNFFYILLYESYLVKLLLSINFKNTINLFIHIARISIGDSPRVHPNILKCLLHSPVAKGYRLVVIASRAMVCKTPTYYLILYPLAYARGCVILRSHILILLLLILLIFLHIHS